jgi:hypothetical protein
MARGKENKGEGRTREKAQKHLPLFEHNFDDFPPKFKLGVKMCSEFRKIKL